MPKNQSFVRRRPIIQLFVSSTFADLKPERDALQRDVFLKLERYCEIRGFQFQAIDLRWGVPSEATLDHRTMRICFEELRHTQEISPKPNFLILLGNRYGWLPLPEEISVAEFQRLEQAIPELTDVTQVLAKSTLARWYRRDDNNLPPVYILQSRTRDLEDGRNYGRGADGTDTQDWLNVQGVLWAIINQAFPADDLHNRFHTVLDDFRKRVANDHAVPLPSIVRFQASATEQEIWRGALAVPNAHEHVLAFFRELDNGAEFSNKAQVFVDADQRPLQELKAQLTEHLGENNIIEFGQVRLYQSTNDKGQSIVDVTTGHLSGMCERVYAALEAIIQRQIDAYWGEETTNRVRVARQREIEHDEHRRFSLERAPADSFVGRDVERNRIVAYLQNESRQPLVVHGESGCGKTALLARASQEATATWNPIVRFLGVTAHSSDIRSLLASVCQELRQRNPRADELSGDVRELTRELHGHFQAATDQQPTVLFLDALDQLSDADNGRSLSWIPFGQLPVHVKLIVSCLSDRKPDDPVGVPFVALGQRGIAGQNFINLDALSADEARTLVFARWLPEAQRCLNSQQKRLIQDRLKTDACRQPLYLKILVEEARLWRSYDPTPKPGANVAELLTALLERLSSPVNHGPTVECALAYIASARRGLTENEILEVLYREREYEDSRFRKLLDAMARNHELPTAPARIPIAIWSRLRFDLRFYLTEHAAPGGAVLNFYHRIVGNVLAASAIRTSDREGYHHRLANYFAGPSQSPQVLHLRCLDELPYHQACCGLWTDLENTLADIDFLQMKVQAGLGFDLLQDFIELDRQLKQRSSGPAAASYEQTSVFQEYAIAFRQVFHTCIPHPEIAAQQLYNNLWGRLPDKSHVLPHLTKRQMGHRSEGVSWYGRLNRAPETSLPREWQQTMTGHNGPVLCLALSPNEHWLAGGGQDGQVIVWSSSLGTEVASFRAGTSPVRAMTWVTMSEPESQLVTGGEDGAISLWDWKSGTQLAKWTAHRGAITALTTCGGLLFSTGFDRQLRAWIPSEGRSVGDPVTSSATPLCLAADPSERMVIYAGEDPALHAVRTDLSRLPLLLSGHVSSTRCLAVDPRQHSALSGADDQTVRYWDLKQATESLTLSGHTGRVTAVAFAKYSGSGTDRRTCGVSAGIDESIRLWDLLNAKEMRLLPGHRGGTNALIASAHRPWMASAGEDGQVRLWEFSSYLESGRTGVGHRGRINCIVASPNEMVITASDDHTARVWSQPSLTAHRVHRVHRRPVTCLCVDPEGHAYSGGGDGLIYAWNPVGGEVLKLFGNPLARSGVRQTDPDVERLLPALQEQSGLSEEKITELRAALQAMARPYGHRSSITALFAPGDNRLVSAGRDGTVRIWDTASCQEIRVIEAGCGPIHTMRYEPTQRFLAVAGTGDAAVLLDLGGEFSSSPLTGHAAPVSALAVKKGFVATASRDRSVRIWARTGVQWDPYASLNARAGVCALVFDAADRFLMSGTTAGDLQCLNLDSPTEWAHSLSVHTGAIRCLLRRARHRQLVSAGDDGWVIVWSVPDLQVRERVHVGFPVTALAEDSAGRLIVGTQYGDVVLFGEVISVTSNTPRGLSP